MAQPSVRVLQTIEHPCGYYTDRAARNLVIDPSSDGLADIYDAVAMAGFRRAGDMIFRPHCRHCQDCRASRIPVDSFRPNRSQRRCRKRNQDIRIEIAEPAYTAERFDLYRAYLSARHPQGGMDNPTQSEFLDFLGSRWARTRFFEFRAKNRLLAVAIGDRLASGWSAVYTFFDPEQSSRGLGSFAIMTLIEQALAERLPYVYLGYWLPDHPKMHYKLAYRPIEIMHAGRWQRVV